MYSVLRNYIYYMNAWKKENFSTQADYNQFELISHLLFCNGNGSKGLNLEEKQTHLTMRMEIKLAGKTGLVSFPFCDSLEQDTTEKDDSDYTLWKPFLIGKVTDLAWEAKPELADISLNSPSFWEDEIRKNYEENLKNNRKHKTLWLRYQSRPETTILGFPSDFNYPKNKDHEKYVPVADLLWFSKEHKINHNLKLFKFAALINEAVIKVYSEIISCPEQREILGENLWANLNNKLENFIAFHNKHFFNINQYNFNLDRESQNL